MRDKKPARSCGRMQSFERAKSSAGPDHLLKSLYRNGLRQAFSSEFVDAEHNLLIALFASRFKADD